MLIVAACPRMKQPPKYIRSRLCFSAFMYAICPMLFETAYKSDFAMSSGRKDFCLAEPLRNTLPKEEAIVEDFNPIFE